MKANKRIDLATLSGIALAAAGLFGGFWLEGIHLIDIGQMTAALIVFCGTLGAVLISMPLEQSKQALKMIPGMFYSPSRPAAGLIDTIVAYSRAARMRGIVSLEQDTELIEDRFLRKAMRLAVDAVGPEMIKSVLDADIAGSRAQAESLATIYETAAGYAPTLGMVGAALGLIQVLKHLDRIEVVGAGVASAFVATIYGLLFANLILLPIATKIRARAELQIASHSLVREGVTMIASGVNPSLVRLNLEALAQLDSEKRQTAKAQALSAALNS